MVFNSEYSLFNFIDIDFHLFLDCPESFIVFLLSELWAIDKSVDNLLELDIKVFNNIVGLVPHIVDGDANHVFLLHLVQAF